ncbi:MAG TPA: alanine racemase [Gillisia sp.]|nr:alanine racemase [Gillisia sp.]
MQNAGETILEIDLGALEHNFKFLKNKGGKNVKFMGVVKAYGYGSDSIAIASRLQDLGIDYLAVAYTSEGIALRKEGIETPILVLHPQPVNFEEIIEHCLEPAIYSLRVLNEFISTAQRLSQKHYPIHLKLNTGLNRLGFTEENIETALQTIKKAESVKVKGVFSHLAASEDWKEREFTLQQIDNFRKLSFTIVNTLGYTPILHLTNTSGIINYPEAAFHMVRSGIGLYGFGNDPEIDKHLKPIGTLKTIISQIIKLKEGDTVGYSREFRAEGDINIATLPLGHADGIKRQFGNGRAGVMVNGQYAPIIGNVCMDIIMINVTGIKCEEGDEVIVFGPGNPANEMALKAGTISYELVTGISQRIKRIIVNR